VTFTVTFPVASVSPVARVLGAGWDVTYVGWRLSGIGRSRVDQILSLDRRILGRLLGVLVLPARILALSVKHCAAHPAEKPGLLRESLETIRSPDCPASGSLTKIWSLKIQAPAKKSRSFGSLEISVCGVSFARHSSCLQRVRSRNEQTKSSRVDDGRDSCCLSE